MDPVQALKSSRAQLELNAITGTYGHEEGDDDTNSEWDDVRELGVQPMQQNSIVPFPLRESKQQERSPPAESKTGIQDNVESIPEDITASMLSGMLFQHLSESRGKATQNSKDMAATLKNVLLATGLAMDDSEMDAPLEYVEEMFAQLGLGQSPGRQTESEEGGVSEPAGCSTKATGKVQDACDNTAGTEEQYGYKHGSSIAAQQLCPTQSPPQDAESHVVSLQGAQRDSLPSFGRSEWVSRLHTTSDSVPVNAASSAHLLDESHVRDAPSDVQVIRHAPQNFSAGVAQARSLQQAGQTTIRDSSNAVDTVTHTRVDNGFLRPESLTQMAAAAAAAAAQAVKNKSDCELSQFMKTILLQQSSWSMQNNAITSGATAAMAPSLYPSNGVRVPSQTQQQQPASIQAHLPPTSPQAYSLSRMPQPYSAVQSPQASLGAAHPAVDQKALDNVSNDEQQVAGTAQAQLDSHSCEIATAGSCEQHQPSAQGPRESDSKVLEKDRSCVQPAVEAVNPKPQDRKNRSSMPNRRRGSVSSTKVPTSRPTSPATQAAGPSSPAVSLDDRFPKAAHVGQKQTHVEAPHSSNSSGQEGLALHSSFKVSVDAALATVQPDSSAVRPLLELPQPDFAGKARSNMKRMLGDEVSYTEIKCTARSAVTEAQNEFMAFKRSLPAAAPLVPTCVQPSWHSMEAMDDVAVFADACVQEVMLRAAQVQNDVSDGVYDVSHARARAVRSQAAVRSLQQITSKQKLAISAYDEKDGCTDAGVGPASDDNRENSGPQPKRGAAAAAVVGEKRQRANIGRRVGRVVAADDGASTGSLLHDTINVKRGDTDRAVQRAQAAYDRAVDRGRARPAVAFGRRLEDPSKSEARTDGKGKTQHAWEHATASGPSAVTGRRGKAPRPKSGSHSATLDGATPLCEMGMTNQGHSRWGNECAQPASISKGREVGEGRCSGAAAVADCRNIPAQDSGPAHAVSTHTDGSSATDTALVALLQGLTEVIRTNNLTQPTVIMAPQPTWVAPAAHQELRSSPCCDHAVMASAHQNTSQHYELGDATAATSHAPQQSEPVEHMDPMQAQSQPQVSSAALHQEANRLVTKRVPVNTSEKASSVDHSIHPPTAATLERHLGTNEGQRDAHLPFIVSPASVWAAFGSRAPRKFLSVVDIVASSIDQDCSSDGGHTLGEYGDSAHKVDIAALEDLIAASTHASGEADGQPGSLQFTPEEAAILKTVVRDLSASQARMSSGHVDGEATRNDVHTASVDDHCSELVSREPAESALTMRQSTISDRSESCGGRSNGSSQLSCSVTPTSDDVNPVRPHSPLESGHLNAAHSTAEAPDEHQDIVHDEERQGSHAGTELARVERNLPLSSSCSGPGDGMEVMGPGHGHMFNPADTRHQCLPVIDEPDQGHMEEKCTGEGSGACSHQESGGPSMSCSAPSVAAAPRARSTLQDRIKERYTELREQTRAALEDSDTCSSDPGRQMQPRAPVLQRRRLSDSPNTPTDLSIASLSLDALHDRPLCRPSRHPQLFRSTEHSEGSLESGAGLVHEPVAQSKKHIQAPIPGDGQITSHRPDDTPLHQDASKHDRLCVEEISAVACGKISGHSTMQVPHAQSPESCAQQPHFLQDISATDPIVGASAETCLDTSIMEMTGNATVSSAVHDLLRPAESKTDDWKISSARQGLEQYEDLRCRLWRPPEDAQIYAAAADYGRLSDVSGYCTEESSKFDSSSLCADPPVKQPLTLDRSLLRRRRLDRLKRRLQQESSFATTTSFASSSDVTASMSHESDLVHQFSS